MVVEHAQTADVAGVLQAVHHVDHLHGAQSEDRLVTSGLMPVAGTSGGKPDADAEVRQDLELAGAFEDEVEFARHFQDQHHLEAHFLGVQGEVDEFLVLIAVADQVGLRIVHVGEGGDQFGLRTGFEAVVEFFPELGDFLDHLSLLVDLDRVNAAILAAVADFLDCPPEGNIDLGDAGVEEVAKAQQDGQGSAAILEALDDLRE